MIRRAYVALPGPMVVKVLIATAVVVVALVALHFFYEWLGATFLDTGGTIE